MKLKCSLLRFWWLLWIPKASFGSPFFSFSTPESFIQTPEHSHIRNISFSVFDTSMNSKVNVIQIQFMKVKRLLGHHCIKRLTCKIVWVEFVEINFKLLIYTYCISANSFLPWIVVAEKNVLCRWICKYCDNYLKFSSIYKLKKRIVVATTIHGNTVLMWTNSKRTRTV